MYTYATLDPRPTPEATRHNDSILGDGSTVLGIEVTIPALAARCGRGNIDPQHLGGDVSTAAVEAAMTWPLPPAGTVVAGLRPDPDTVAAMAVLALRAGIEADNRDNKTRCMLLQGDWDGIPHQVALVAEADKEAAGPWPGPRPVAVARELVGPVAPLGAMTMDHRLDLATRVARTQEWLRSGTFPCEEEYRRQLLNEAREALEGLDVKVVSGVAVVVGDHRLARDIGYRQAPVFVATNPTFRWQGGPSHRKHTVARWNSSIPLDWDGMRDALSTREPGWGGSSSIVGSPQGAGSTLTTEEVVDIVVSARDRAAQHA